MDMTGRLEYFVTGLRSQMEEIQEKGKKTIISEKIVNAFSGYNLNIRQAKIIRYLVINDRIDNEQCQTLCNSIKRTATRDLTGLVEKSLLVKYGEKKGTYYLLSSEISEKIRDMLKGQALRWQE